MKAPYSKLASGIAAAGLIACLFLFFAPTQLGGATNYSVTSGISMEPMFHKGDLAVVRKHSSYFVGQVVLYQSPTLHRPVLHRIIAIQNGRYFFKGDNNSFVDPGYATKHELLGTLWFHVGSVGSVLHWFGRPLHAGLIGALAVLLLFGGGFRRKRRYGQPSRVALRLSMVTRTAAHHGNALRAGGAVGLAAGAVVLAVGFTLKPHHIEQRAGAYRNTATFSYAAHTDKRSLVYPSGVVRTGDPVFLNVVHTMTVRAVYRFTTTLPHAISGTIALRGRIASASGWHTFYTFVKSTAFRGDRGAVSAVVPLGGLFKTLQAVSVAAGSSGEQYVAALQPEIHLHGFVGGKTLNETFAPELPFVVTPASVRLATPTSSALPVAGFTPPSAEQELQAQLNPSESGSVSERVASHVRLGPLHGTVDGLRFIGIVLALLSFATLCFASLTRDPTRVVPPLEERLALRRGCVLVRVDALPPAKATTMDVSDFLSLVRLALYRLRPILVTPEPLYAVDDDTGRFVYQLREAASPESAPPVRIPRPHPPRRMLARGAVLVVILGGLAGVASSFTASNTVPPSNVGASAFARTLAQIAPAACSNIMLTNLVVATGSSTTGTAANDLILGKNGSGSFTYNGAGGDDCIVAGGTSATTNTLDGSTGTGDVCLAPAAAAKNTFKNCETHS